MYLSVFESLCRSEYDRIEDFPLIVSPVLAVTNCQFLKCFYF